MTIISNLTCASSLCLFLLCGAPDAEAATATHRLVVAAHPSLGLDNAEVDDVLSGMNAIMRRSTYGNPWDTPCADVEFVRSGNVTADQRLPTAGNYDDLVASLKSVAPKANVLVVLGINCAGVQGAAGCGRVGGEPLIVGLYKGFNDQLWLHERGHNVGLQHSSEFGLDSSHPPSIGRRFMFYQLGIGHVGKIEEECKAFKDAKLASINKTIPKAHIAAAVFPVAAAVASSAAPAAPNVESELTKAAQAAGLTPQAYRVVGPPWMHGVPYESLKTLKADDIASIRKMLEGSSVNQYWPQAITALAAIGGNSDIQLVNRALNLPLPALPPTATTESKVQYRDLLRTKLSAPVALGILANRMQSEQAAAILQSSASLEKAAVLVGGQNASTLSKQALQGLSLANTPQSRSFLRTVTVKPALPPDSSPQGPQVAPLSAADVERLRANTEAVSTGGIERYFQQSRERLR